MCDSSDAELLVDWLEGQREAAFHALTERYAGLVHMAAMRSCGDESIAAEAAQLTFIALARRARALVSRASLAGWLHITAVLHAKNLLRKHRRESHKIQLLRMHMETHPPGPSADLEDWRRIQPVLDASLAALSSTDRETILLRFYRTLSVGEIAATLGIATAAAQKRLDRAIHRLRRQLARRGCPVGGALGAVIAAGFLADAQAAMPAPSVLASKALAASAATATTTLTTITVIAMTKKTTVAAGAALLLAGVGAVAYIQYHPNSAATAPPASTAAATHAGKPGGFAPAETDRPNRPRVRSGVKNPELAAKYGESRTNLSKHITENVISLLEDTVAMGEMATSGEMAGAFGGPDMAMRMGLGKLGNDLKLTPEQREKAKAVYAEYQKRQLANSKDAIERLKKDPTSLMHLMLASDAFARGEIDEAEYKRLQVASGQDLGGVLSPMDERNFRGGRPLQDEAFVSEFKTILDPTQQQTMQAALDERLSNNPAGAIPEGNIANLPSMELEKLDTTIESVKKLTTGVKSMMEGFGGLKDLGPMMQGQSPPK